jgi:hypothetical protein
LTHRPGQRHPLAIRRIPPEEVDVTGEEGVHERPVARLFHTVLGERPQLPDARPRRFRLGR